MTWEIDEHMSVIYGSTYYDVVGLDPGAPKCGFPDCISVEGDYIYSIKTLTGYDAIDIL